MTKERNWETLDKAYLGMFIPQLYTWACSHLSGTLTISVFLSWQ